MIIPPFQSVDEMRLWRREIINNLLRSKHFGLFYGGFRALRYAVRREERERFYFELCAYKDQP
jgi:hypothetical protein